MNKKREKARVERTGEAGRNALPEEVVSIRPNPGKQEAFLASPYDIVIYGGGAGSGKTWAMLMECARHMSKPGMASVIFRRTYPQITNEGGLWDTSLAMYPLIGAKPRQSDLSWEWPSGATVRFAHMQHEKDKLAWMGSQVPLICFDELTHFTQSQFFYMLSRNRLGSRVNVRPYIRATCNPDSDSWVAEFIEWWIDQDTGFPIQSRSGVPRYFVRDNGVMKWADSAEELGPDAKSVTFIPAKIEDNAPLMQNDPQYLGNLKALPLLERAQLLDGNWKARASAGMIFRKSWFPIVDEAPAGGRIVRYWDRAASRPSPAYPDPDWTRGVLQKRVGGRNYILDVCSLRDTPHAVIRAMRACADQDGPDVEVWAEEDPGQAGKSELDQMAQHFSDRQFRRWKVDQDKVTRALPMSAAAEQGNVILVRGAWNREFLDEHDRFADWSVITPKPKPLPHDDIVDATTGGYNVLATGRGPRVY